MGLGLPRPHVLRPAARRGSDTDGLSELPRPGERRAALGLHRMKLGRDGAVGESSGEAGTERAATNLHEGAVDTGQAEIDELVDDLPTDRSPTVEAQPVLGSLHGERDGTVGHGDAEAVQARIAGRVTGAAGAGDKVGAEGGKAIEHLAISRRGDKDLQRPLRGCGQRCRGEGGVAARRDGERRTVAVIGGEQVQHDRRQVPGLVRAGDVAGFVLHPYAAAVVEPERVGELVGPPERGDRESVSLDTGYGGVKVMHDVDPILGRSDAQRRQPVDVAGERVRIIDRERTGRRRHEHVIRIGGRRPRAAPRPAGALVDDSAAHGTPAPRH